MAPLFTGFRFGFAGGRGNTFSAFQEFLFTGFLQTFSVPSNTTFIRTKVWGAGGGGSHGTGGAGGMVDAYIPVNSNDTLSIYVAGGGVNSTGDPGGAGGYGYSNGGSGGNSDVSGVNGWWRRRRIFCNNKSFRY